jgi:hypothetical protein
MKIDITTITVFAVFYAIMFGECQPAKRLERVRPGRCGREGRL